MNETAVLEVGREALLIIIIIIAPIMLAGLVIGLAIALFQALTTIQEMTLTFVPKIIVVFLATILFLPFMMRTLIEYTHTLFDRMVSLG